MGSNDKKQKQINSSLNSNKRIEADTAALDKIEKSAKKILDDEGLKQFVNKFK